MSRTVRAARSLPVDWVERIAVGASMACLAHCLVLPIVVAALPILSSVLPVSEAFHVWMLAIVIPAAGFALVQGRSRHGAVFPLLVGAAGIVLLASGALLFGGTAWDMPTTVVGSLMLAGAHVANWRLRRACPC